MKKLLIVIILGMAISFALPTFSQDQKAVDSEARQQIEALLICTTLKKPEFHKIGRIKAALYQDFFVGGILVLLRMSFGRMIVGEPDSGGVEAASLSRMHAGDGPSVQLVVSHDRRAPFGYKSSKVSEFQEFCS
jgi:hypothetical protein